MFNFGFLLEESGGGGSMLMLIIMAVVFIPFFFLMTRRQKKQERKDAEMRDSLQVGDEVTTIGGIIGKVVSIKAETFVLETTKDKTKIRFLKGAIRSVDVKAADIAATVMEASAEKPAEAAEPAPAEIKEDKKKEKSAKKKKDNESES